MTSEISAAVKIGPSYHVVLPAAVRDALGVREGDRVEFVIEDGEVRVVAPHMRLAALWAKNTCAGDGDAATEVRAERAADLAVAAAKWDRIDAQIADDHRTEEQITTEILRSLGVE